MNLKACRKVYRDWISGLYGVCTFRAALRTAICYHNMRENRIRMWNAEAMSGM